MIRLLLLGTAGCHLCEQAEELLAALPPAQVAVEQVDIAEAEQWQARYAIRIPVLYHPETTSELCWPFDQTDLRHFIEAL
ncbi:glutaredoxin family protein [Methylovulum psychrotolerans]|uniref:Glutaredoxin family protein n=1 Tax=Methylovulum psychrotolerans TaxID=1704499 RepID=A0A2S5CN76_9GAMM|nr:glutaredoxin family protein [Methylovulum psychrotolerans]MBT9099421.1 glutaredoxin family protein [Methylovulum psychrotolerans]POZ52244.1 glutaredoxin family protein [Methylovulum psychrotolerans]